MKSQYLTIALEAVQAAEKIILHYLSNDPKVFTKADLSPVTIADQEAEEAIKTIIQQHFPDHTFYGEEGEKVDLHNHQGYTWIIDPIDGTKSFMRHIPLFATQLALLKDGELILGVSNAPALKELMYAEKDQGCYLNGERVQVGGAAQFGDAYASYGGLKYFAKNDLLEGVATLSQTAKWSRGVGDFWSYHLLAQGKLDIMVEATTKLWDIAALKVIVEEAGGRFTQMDGQPITAGSTSALATNGLLHEETLKLFRA
ncbi:MAG TPA: inositol monophosphatase family protein [Candidatus Saccharimonadales bacterium]|nr:inositol monophosphatase family protein [Candidatus Saccharimonadales bacterium]